MGIDKTYTDEGVIAQIVREETMFLRHYIGQVVSNNDTLGKGRVLVTILDLGWDTPDLAAWCFPRFPNSIVTPDVNQWVEVYFLNGDESKPVYMGIASEILNQLPNAYDRMPTTRVIFEDPTNKDNITYDSRQKKLNIDLSRTSGETSITGGTINLLSAAQSLLRGDDTFTFLTTLVTEINAFITVYNTHTHVPTNPPNPPPAIPATAPQASIKSTTIKGE